MTTCHACEHEHAGEQLAYICVGCSCPHYPIGFDYAADRWDICGGCDEPWPCAASGMRG